MLTELVSAQEVVWQGVYLPKSVRVAPWDTAPRPGLNLLHQLERDTGKTLVLVPGESRDSQGVTELVPRVVCTLCQGDLPEEIRAAGGY